MKAELRFINNNHANSTQIPIVDIIPESHEERFIIDAKLLIEKQAERISELEAQTSWEKTFAPEQLQKDYEALKVAHNELVDKYNDLRDRFGMSQEEISSLHTSCREWKKTYDSLNAECADVKDTNNRLLEVNNKWLTEFKALQDDRDKFKSLWEQKVKEAAFFPAIKFNHETKPDHVEILDADGNIIFKWVIPAFSSKGHCSNMIYEMYQALKNHHFKTPA